MDRDQGLELIDRSIAFTEEMDRLVADLFARADGPLTTADVATAVGEFCGMTRRSRSRPSTRRPPT